MNKKVKAYGQLVLYVVLLVLIMFYGSGLEVVFSVGDSMCDGPTVGLVDTGVGIDDIGEGDVVVYEAESEERGEFNVRHRVVEKFTGNGKTLLSTKGDCNELIDQEKGYPYVSGDEFKGKVIFTI